MNRQENGFDIDRFDYGKAEETLAEAGCPFPEHIWNMDSRRSTEDFMQQNGLNANDFFLRARR